MLKKLILLLIVFPSSFVSADETITNNDTTNSASDSENPPRSTDYFFSQCYFGVPPVVVENDPLPLNQRPISIDSNRIYSIDNKLSFEGDVELTQGIKTLKADKLSYSQNDQTASAQGNINFVTGEITLNSDSIETQLSTDQITMKQVNYQFHGQGGRGNAEQIYGNGVNLYELNTSSYSACPPGDRTWSINASTIYIDNEAGVASAYNAVLRIKDVPILYLPYITYPTSDKRKTGLLFPTYAFPDTNGFTFTQPLYINITNNMDATLTGVYMENRGTMVKAEYRYLFGFGDGKFVTEYLQDDKIYNETRYLNHWEHSLSLTKNWSFSSDYTQVSDDDYLDDIDTDYGTYTDSQLLQTAKIGYSQKSWESELEVRDFQVLDADDDDISHQVLPKLSFSRFTPLGWKGLEFDWYSEITQFEHSSDEIYTGTRIHLEPKLTLPLYYNSFFVNTELKYRMSYYQQSIPEDTSYDYDDLEENVTRYVPSFKINSGLNFERDFIFSNNNWKQTLVPQFQYLYVPYRDQSNIGIYDSTEMEQDYYALFRDNRFSGYDRIADANLITFGFSSSILNDQGQEKIRFAIGQNYYYTASKVNVADYDDDSTDDDSVSGSSIIADFDVNLNDKYFFHSGVEWDADENEIENSNLTIEKRWKHDTYAQINYRFIAVGDDGDDDDLVNQLGSKFNWSINDQWTSFGSYYYDLEYLHPYESIIGLKYQSCCWSLGLTYNNYITSMDTDSGDYETEATYEINFELKGLGGAASGSGSDSLFDYGRPFYLQ
jgi:LPS-assembly protein